MTLAPLNALAFLAVLIGSTLNAFPQQITVGRLDSLHLWDIDLSNEENFSDRKLRSKLTVGTMSSKKRTNKTISSTFVLNRDPEISPYSE